MKLFAAIALGLCLTPCISRAGALNLATLTCEKYESEVLPAAASNPTVDSLNTVMWLFGYSVAKSGAHVMYPGALGPFGFALDNECKSNPAESLLDALGIVKPEPKNPMDLIRFLQPYHIISRELNINRPNRFINVLNFSSANDRRVHALVK